MADPDTTTDPDATTDTDSDRPKPYPTDDEGNRIAGAEPPHDDATPEASAGPEDAKDDAGDDPGDDDQDLIDRSKIDFDPDDGLLSGTAIDGTSEIPGPHEDEDGEVSTDG